MPDVGKTPPSKNQRPTTARTQPLYFPSFRKLGIVLVLLFLLALFAYSYPHPQSSPPNASTPAPTITGEWDTVTEDPECPLPTTRYNIHTGKAACYPSSGGVWMSEIGPLELLHLGIDRFQSTPRSRIQADEDAFCTKLRQFGGDWYNPASGKDLRVGGRCHELDEFMPVLSISRQVGFPRDGGVWVLGTDEETGQFPAEIVTVRNALTMSERCMVLEKLGAVYCDELENCSLLRDLQREPYEYARDNGLLEG